MGFIAGTNSASAAKTRTFLDELAEPTATRRAGETLLAFVERHERVEKSFVLGRLLVFRIEGHIGGQRFMELAAALDRATVDEIIAPHRAVDSGSVHAGCERGRLGPARTPSLRDVPVRRRGAFGRPLSWGNAILGEISRFLVVELSICAGCCVVLATSRARSPKLSPKGRLP